MVNVDYSNHEMLQTLTQCLLPTAYLSEYKGGSITKLLKRHALIKSTENMVIFYVQDSIL